MIQFPNYQESWVFERGNGDETVRMGPVASAHLGVIQNFGEGDGQ